MHDADVYNYVFMSSCDTISNTCTHTGRHRWHQWTESSEGEEQVQAVQMVYGECCFWPDQALPPRGASGLLQRDCKCYPVL